MDIDRTSEIGQLIMDATAKNKEIIAAIINDLAMADPDDPYFTVAKNALEVILVTLSATDKLMLLLYEENCQIKDVIEAFAAKFPDPGAKKD
jgi:hypothetical protein